MNELKAFYSGDHLDIHESIGALEQGQNEPESKTSSPDLQQENGNQPVGEREVSYSAIDLFRHPVVRMKTFMIMLNWLVVD